MERRSVVSRGRGLRSRRAALIGIGIAALVAIVVFVLHRWAGDDGFSLVDDPAGDWAYLAVFLLVFGDAICALLPGETTLNAASTLAAQGALDLVPVMLAGALGAVLGDSALYWIARTGAKRIAPQLEKAKRNEKVVAALDFMGSSAGLLLVAGRYVPGLRFAVNATMGLSAYPYRSFLLWSSVGGVAWSVYTCGLAYLIGKALAEFPLASIVISGLVTTAVFGVLFVVVRRNRKGQAKPTARAAEPTL